MHLIPRQVGDQMSLIRIRYAKVIDKRPESQYFWTGRDLTWGLRAMSEQHSPLGVSRVETTTPAGSVPGLGGGATAGVGQPTGRRRNDRIISASALMQTVVDQASGIARSNDPVLLIGPSGSGRKHVARAIHQWSARAAGPLIEFSVVGMSEPFQLRELFGDASSSGALARAEGGTLLIEGADHLGASVQARLSEAMRESAASTKSARVLTTVTAARVDGGVSPIAGQRILIASLADRTEDILPLAAHFLAEFGAQESVEVVGFSADARRWLVEEAWPGNVRELRERIRQAIRLAGRGAISAEALMLSTEGDEVPSFKDAKRVFETRYVEGLLRRCSGNISRAARMAKKDRKDFYDVIRRTGVDPGQFRG
jgi:two-component system response regulator GlrR